MTLIALITIICNNACEATVTEWRSPRSNHYNIQMTSVLPATTLLLEDLNDQQVAREDRLPLATANFPA